MSTAKRPILWDLPEFCRVFGIAPRTAYRWRQRNVGPQSVKVGGKLMWDRDVVISWLSENHK